jgi:CheY-like chemotaxis protein
MLENSHDAEVLIVDDDAPSSSMLADILNLEGYTVACSPNGKEALDYLRSGPPPRLIILDLQMPVMDGWQFRREQKMDNLLRGIPVVVLSGLPGAAGIQADAIMHKPVDVERLLGLLRGFVHEAHHQN